MLKNKNIINDDLGHYGIPGIAVKLFIQTYPLVSSNGLFCAYIFFLYVTHPIFLYWFLAQCVPNKMQPLKMILSKSCGYRCQMDLIEMPLYCGFNYIQIWICAHSKDQDFNGGWVGTGNNYFHCHDT